MSAQPPYGNESESRNGNYPDYTPANHQSQSAPGYHSPQAGSPNGGFPQPGYGAAEHPQAKTVFILGIIGIFFTICAFIAWYLGAQAKKEIANGAPYVWDGNLKTGYTLGMIFSILGIVAALLAIMLAAVGIITFTGSVNSY